MADPVLQPLTAALDLVVLEPVDHGFRAISDQPPWWRELIPDRQNTAAIRVDDELPFLAAFFEEAGPHWATGATGWLESGIWEEAAGHGGGLYLEALAGSVDGRCLLVIRRADAVANERIELLQQGRANKLAYESDLAEHTQLEDELRRAKQAADDLNAAKSDFLARMTHELRTPMNGVIGMTDLLLETGPTAEQRGYLEAVRKSAHSLLDIINDILDFSKGEVGRIDLVDEPFALREAVTDSLRLLEVSARQKGLDFRLDFAGETPDWLLGDAGRLRQILVNLVGNAIKFTTAGQVAIEVGPEPRSSEMGQLRFTIRDTGPGIPPDKLNTIFDPFAQAGVTSRAEGTGLGLSIAQQIVELMRGRLWVANSSPSGTTFTFTARFGLANDVASGDVTASDIATESAQPEHAPKSTGLRILVADDNTINRWLAITILEKRGHSAEAVADGSEAVAATANERFDLVLMDCQMPELDGFEATRAIRAREVETAQRVPIVALSAQATEEDQQRSLDAGMDAYLSKPLDAKRLMRVIDELTQNNTES